jgi:phage tail-like protein
MRDTMPAVYLEPGPGGEAPPVERWLGALEEVLDPVVALLDNLDLHVEPTTAPDVLTAGLLAWLGLEDEAAALDGPARRRLLSRATDVAAWRGTLRGLRLAVALVLPDAGVRVDDRAVPTRWPEPRDAPPAPDPVVHVRCTRRMDPAQLRMLRRIVECQLPIGVTLDLQVR